MRFLGFCFWLYLFGAVWDLLAMLPMVALARVYMKGDLPAHAVRIATSLNYLIWIVQPVITAAATRSTVQRHTDAWQWLYFGAGILISHQIAAAPIHQTLKLRDLVPIFIIFLACYYWPMIIPKPLWRLGGWIGR